MKDIDEYKLYIFDLDGTLYNQSCIRRIMFKRLLKYYFLHPLKYYELIILQDFRKTKDDWVQEADDYEICQFIAKKRKTSTKTVEQIVNYWIYENPLDVIEKCAKDDIIKWIKNLRSKGKKVVIFSDYPTKDKLKALNIDCDGQYSSIDKRIKRFKPSPKGLNIIMKDFNIAPKDAIMIGDRKEKDGACAENAGIDFLII